MLGCLGERISGRGITASIVVERLTEVTDGQIQEMTEMAVRAFAGDRDNYGIQQRAR